MDIHLKERQFYKTISLYPAYIVIYKYWLNEGMEGYHDTEISVIKNFWRPPRKPIITRLPHNDVRCYLKSGRGKKSIITGVPLYKMSIITRLDFIIFFDYQGTLEFIHPKDSVFSTVDKSYSLFGHGGMLFWFATSVLFFTVSLYSNLPKFNFFI